MNRETTDITLFVRTSGEEIAIWNRRRIVDALIRETDIDVETAEKISREVEKQIVASGISTLTTALIRELVDAKLIERGLEKARRMHARLGFPLYDARQLILHRNKENANVPHGPEGTNLILAEGIKRDYALHDVFSQEVGDAHAIGDIHLHSLGYIDRPYSSCQSLEYLKKFGLNLPQSLTVAKPAKHAEVLIAHMVRFGAVLQAHFAGIISWDIVNISFAPYLQGFSDYEVRQIAQMLIYEFSQMTSARGGQPMFTDIHLYWDVPDWLADMPAIGPSGKPTGSDYKDYTADARRFALALFEVFKKGDGMGRPFIFPRPIVHITDRFAPSADHEGFLDLVCRVAAEKGNPCFCFDRRGFAGNAGEAAEPWKIRSFNLHNVTINLPRLAYKAKGDNALLKSLLAEVLELAVKAHVQKKAFIEKLLSFGETGPLSLLTMNHDGFPYFRMDKTSCLIGMVGLNELLLMHKGKQLHESQESVSYGLRLMDHIKQNISRLGKKHGLRLSLGQSHAETTSHRFARLDLRYYSPEAGRVVRGNLAKGEIYYTNSTHLNVSSATGPSERIAVEGNFHPIIEGEAVTNLWLGAETPASGVLSDIVIKALRDTQSSQIVFSPDFTTCGECHRTSRGLNEDCSFCGSVDVDVIARITQYFSRVSDWNKGKLAELRDRNRNEAFLR